MKHDSINKVCCADSAYGLLLFFLITGNDSDNTFFFFSKHIPEIYRNKLNKNSVLIKYPKTDNKIIIYITNIYNYLYVLFICLKNRIQKYPAYGFDFIGWTTPIESLSSSFCLLEDGVSNYVMPSVKLKRFEESWWRKFLTTKTKWFHKPFGLSDKVERVYLTGILPIPKEIEHKVQLIDLTKLWLQTDDMHRKFITDFFTGNSLSLQGNRRIIIITQCLSEDLWMSEDEKTNIYSHIIRIYGAGNVVLKTHPRECTDYKNLFPDIAVINYPCPFQLLTLLGWTFDEAITVNSTAIFSLPDAVKKTVLVAPEYLNKNMYGTVMESIETLERQNRHL